MASNTCPHCGEKLARRYLSGQSAGDAAEAWQEVTYTEPARPANTEGDVAVPLLQALITGALTGTVTLILMAMFFDTLKANVWPELRFWHLIYTWLGTTATVTLAKWRDLLDDSRDLLRKMETYVGRDIDGDGHVGEPKRIRLEMIDKRDGKNKQIFEELDIDPLALETFMRAALNGQTLAVSRWTGRNGLFTRSEFDQLTATFRRAGILAWDGSKNQGHILTRAGEAAFRNWLGA
jgi:hypothetical protein